MSIYGHFTQQYYGNKISFPEKSFLISGISFYKENCYNITYDTELIMKYEPDNKFDPFAISIMNNNKIIGYVPNTEIKELCKNNITESLKIINIKIINGNYGIRVIPKCFYVYDPILESKVFFSYDES
jgi:hypothetical protein